MAGARDEAGLHAVVEDRLRGSDLRYTAGRRAVVEALVALGHPASIGDLGRRRPDLPRSSVYRHLVDLQGVGVVRRIAASDEFARFELAEDLTEHHHHLLCTTCGRVIDVAPSRDLERSVTRHLADLVAAVDFEPHSHRVDVLGVCGECR
jgi:Fur family transcriptional regulator, ferric uptake regulator